MSSALERGDIDAAVIAADGCGTAIITEPALLQGMCGRISGLVETSPLQVVLDAVDRDNVLDPETVPLDMVKGAELAVSKGFHLFSVTVARPDDAVTLRKIYGDGVQVQAEAMRPHARAVAGLAGRRLGYTCMGRYKPHG